jgi:hypothetical protein
MHHEQQARDSCDTVYARNMVCFRYISVNTLHKGDNVIIIIIIIISKSFRKYLSSIPGKHDMKELQKTAILGKAHILREVLM